MNKLFSLLLKRPFNMLLLSALVLLCIALVAGGKSFDINLHDSYFVMSLATACGLLIITLFIIWGIYKLAEKVLWNKWLIWFHVVITLAILCVFLTANIWITGYQAFKLFSALSILFLIAQAAFLLNIVGGLIKHFLYRKPDLNQKRTATI